MKIAVVGGGISGLSAAWELRERAEVTIFEPGRLGGKILTEDFDGRSVESGPDAFITRSTDALDLCSKLGIDDLVSPSGGRTLLWWGGRLRTLPEGLVLGAPMRLRPLLRSRLLSLPGLVRAAGDVVAPRRHLDRDVSVRDLIKARFGSEVADRLVDPLVGGIHAGQTDELGAEATVPQLLQLARQSRSLYLALRRSSLGASGGPAFMAPRKGLGLLAETLGAQLVQAGASFRPVAVERVARRAGGWELSPTGELFDAVVLAVDAATSSRLLGSVAPPGLDGIRTASVVLVTLGYSRLDVPGSASGFLVPRSSGRLMTACSFGSLKWPHWATPGRTVLRVSTGRAHDTRALKLEDDALVTRIVEELQAMMRTSAQPDSWRVTRWPDSFPQYTVGHVERVGRIRDELCRNLPGLAVCGASYDGAGIPSCIASGRNAALRLLTTVDEK